MYFKSVCAMYSITSFLREEKILPDDYLYNLSTMNAKSHPIPDMQAYKSNLK